MRNTVRYAAGLLVAAGAVFAFSSPAVAATEPPYDPSYPPAYPAATGGDTNSNATIVTTTVGNNINALGGALAGNASVDIKNVGNVANSTTQLSNAIQIKDVSIKYPVVKPTYPTYPTYPVKYPTKY
ncbi:MAG TPA: hypothetical protein VN408_14730 [Actinoplanes sp.]|nr:hypothetical protein [Actinoplanes sp.]